MVNHREEQSKLESALEQILNVGSGIVVALLIWNFLIVPFPGVYGVSREPGQTGLAVTLTFTVVSMLRGYWWRRLFATRLIHRFVSWLFSLPAFLYYLEKVEWLWDNLTKTATSINKNT